ncbi:MAG: outer membrane beta-barrel protein [Treponema sp.]|jgi:hypothetical protein|nr:outer membrane beta-barrel protein [Treponema sp.]
MKKLMLLLVLAAAVAGGTFAQSEIKLSVGGGLYFTSDFGGGVEISSGKATASLKTPYAGGGGFVFFDATYAELSLGIFGGGGATKLEGSGLSTEEDMSYTGLDIGLLGKYPVTLNEQLSVFPFFGIKYRAMLSVKEEGNMYKNSNGDDAPGDFSALWFKFGGGVDFSLTDQLYVRGELSYGLRFSNTFELDYVDATSPALNPKALLGHGLEITVAAGYRF